MAEATLPSAGRAIFSLAMPVMVLRILAISTYIVDAVICGRLPNAGAQLAGMAIAFLIIVVMEMTANGLVIGAIALISRARGGNDPERVRQIVDQSARLIVALALVLVPIAFVLSRPLFHAFGLGDEAVESGVAHFRMLLAGAVFAYLGFVYGGVFAAMRNTRTPLVCGAISVAINAGLTYALGLGVGGLPQLGVVGIALGTVISQVVNMTLLMFAARRAKLPVSFWPGGLVRDRAREIARVGMPAASDMLLLSVHSIAMVAMLSHVAQASVAAHGIGTRVQLLTNLPAITIGGMAAPLVGGALGGGDPVRARALGRAALIMNVSIMLVLGSMLVVNAPHIVAIFSVPEGSMLSDLTVDWIRLIGIGTLPVAIHLARVGVINGAGATRTSLKISLVSIVVQIPLAAVLAFGFDMGAHGVWLALLVSYVLRAGLAELAYRRSPWAIVGVSVPTK